MAQRPQIVLDLLVFQRAVAIFDWRASNDGADIGFRKSSQARPGKMAVMDSVLDAATAALRLGWLKQKGELGCYAHFRRLHEADRLDILACCLAMLDEPPERLDSKTAARWI